GRARGARPALLPHPDPPRPAARARGGRGGRRLLPGGRRGGAQRRERAELTAWLFLLQGVTVPLTCWVLSRDRRAFLAGLRRHARPGMLGGVLSLIAYAVVVWAQSLAPLALVSALRETGVIVAVFAGRLLFREPLTTRGVAASGLVAVGIVLLRATTA